MAVGASAAPGARGYFLAMVIATDADGYIYLAEGSPINTGDSTRYHLHHVT